MGVVRKIVKFAVGFAPAVAGVPPVQSSTISPTSSVKPSARSVGGTAAVAVHEKGACALAVAANPNMMATAINTENLRKSAISFSL
jgi:hypothetical protein